MARESPSGVATISFPHVLRVNVLFLLNRDRQNGLKGVPNGRFRLNRNLVTLVVDASRPLPVATASGATRA